MKYLVVDIGNSFYKVALFNSDGVMVRNIDGVERVDFKEFCRGEQIAGSIVCSVRRGVKKALARELEQITGSEVVVMNRKTPLPITNGYATPKTLGLDRIVAAVAAHRRFPEDDVVVVDLGTAITVDFVSSQGEFRGGNISAGFYTRLQALSHYTSRLPMLDDEQIERMKREYVVGGYGKTTAEALFYGAVEGIRHEIEGYLHENTTKKAFFTGGDALFFEMIINLPIFVCSEATLRGLYEVLLGHLKAKN